MEKNIFENLLITTFYIRYNEKKKLLNGKHFVRLFKKVEKDVCKLEESLLVEDREQSCQHIKEKLLSVLENNNEIPLQDLLLSVKNLLYNLRQSHSKRNLQPDTLQMAFLLHPNKHAERGLLKQSILSLFYLLP